MLVSGPCAGAAVPAPTAAAAAAQSPFLAVSQGVAMQSPNARNQS